ncbi:MAG: DUF58 domain-containing protein [Hyphomicrobiaceae bacterium]|nr:DUF58 domain-containing protein [Hyphomicrobiaceae bacterium]
MAAHRTHDRAEILTLEAGAHALAERLPELMVEASRIAHTVAHGIHGRRRAGPGETFWQFRQYQPGDATSLIDWRRTASASHVYIRQREWEAAHTMWLWPDLSTSMEFRSSLAPVTKRDRALVLGLALSELLVRGGERVGLLGLTQPTASRKAVVKLAEAILMRGEEAALSEGLPPRTRLQRFSGVILISDFLDPIEAIGERIAALAGHGVKGHVVQVLDPAEETLPFEGRLEFIGPEGGERWVADRVESLRADYQAKLTAHRAALIETTRKLGWSFLLHHTDRPASEPLLNLIALLQGGGSYQYQAIQRDVQL